VTNRRRIRSDLAQNIRALLQIGSAVETLIHSNGAVTSTQSPVSLNSMPRLPKIFFRNATVRSITVILSLGKVCCNPIALAVSFLVPFSTLVFLGCATQSVPPPPAAAGDLQNSYHDDHLSAASDQAISEFEDAPRTRYTIGPGDRISVTVWARPELSGAHVVGPDGDIQVPFLGSVRMADLTPDQASAKLTSALSEYYLGAYATITMLSYSGNSVTVLGHVAHPGLLTFNDDPTLLEVLARAGTLQTDGKASTDIARCAIFRGKDRAVWIDLRPLYRGHDMALNLRMQRGDYVYVPDPSDQLVYVMGQVSKPGAYPLTPNMSFLDAIAQAGGPTDAGQPAKIVLARPHDHLQQVVDLKTFLSGNGEANYSLEEGDIIYVPKNGVARVGYVLQQLNPLSTVFFAAALF
jgi:polysaccharide export outer membrane protein